MKQIIGCCLGAGLIAMLSGCQAARGPNFDARAESSAKLAELKNLTTVADSGKINPEWLRPPVNRFTLGPGDRLEIEMLNDPTTRTTTVVGPDGKVYYYLLPGLDVWGLTLNEAKKILERELEKFVRGQPQVSITVRSVESQRIWLLGRLNAPGVYTMYAPMTLLESLSLAGGPTSPSSVAPMSSGFLGNALSEDVADLKRSFIARKSQTLPVDFYRLLKKGDMSQNIYLQPDDFVYVPSAVSRQVSVLGAVSLPKTVPYRESVSLVSAIANAHGTIKDAHLSNVAIVRGALSHPKIAIVDYGDIIKGRTTDILLEPGDIVYVPFTPYRTLTRYVDLIVRTFVQTLAANEGARAVSRNAQPVNVNIGVGTASTVAPPP